MVNENDDVTKAEVIKGLGYGLDQSSLAAIVRTKFKPGKQDGKTVKVQVAIPLVFKLR